MLHKFITIVTLFTIVIMLVALTFHRRPLLLTEPRDDKVLYYRIKDTLNQLDASLDLPKTFMDVANKSGTEFKKVTHTDARFLLFETFNDIDTSITTVAYPPHVQFLFGLAGCDRIASKSLLAYMLKQSLPNETVKSIIPETYILENGLELNSLKAAFVEGDVYIMKKNIQQQKGVLMSASLDEILYNASHDPGFVVVQRMLQDPFLIDGRKINMRVYMLVIARPQRPVEFYYYHDGFMYYTIDTWRRGSTHIREVITTGLAGREMYKGRPLTHQDLAVYLGPSLFAHLRANMTTLFQHLKRAYAPMFQEENQRIPGTKFAIFGADIAPDANLGCKLMEVNKGPDLSYKDDRDKALKIQMLHDALVTVGMIQPDPGALASTTSHKGFLPVV